MQILGKPIYFWIASALMAIICVGAMCMVAVSQLIAHENERDARLRQLDDSRAYIIDTAALLGSDWVNTSTSRFNDQIDLSGYSRSIAGSATRLTTNLANHDVLIVQTVTAYEHDDDARSRFLPQKRAVVENSVYTWENQALPHNIHLNAEKYEIVCGNLFNLFDEVKNTTCWAFFLYDRYIVAVEARIRRNEISYLTFDDLIPLFQEIDVAFNPPTP